jgi:hypothetical protein
VKQILRHSGNSSFNCEPLSLLWGNITLVLLRNILNKRVFVIFVPKIKPLLIIPIWSFFYSLSMRSCIKVPVSFAMYEYVYLSVPLYVAIRLTAELCSLFANVSVRIWTTTFLMCVVASRIWGSLRGDYEEFNFFIYLNCRMVFAWWQWYYNKTQHTNNTPHSTKYSTQNYTNNKGIQFFLFI